MYTGPTRTPGVLTIRAAQPASVTFAMDDRLPYITVRHGAVRAAKARCVRREVVVLAGVALVEADVDTLLAAMRDAQHAAQRAYDVRLEELRDRQQEWTR